MRQFLIGLLFCALGAAAFAAPNFPILTGRVVDSARIISSPVYRQLTQTLGAYEARTSNQVVVATLSSLDGLPIEEYGVQLGRHWKIGQKGKDNGVLLIVAPSERAVRIEVGYGLEGTLTDAASSQIIQQVILPNFREDQMEKGVVEGTRAILTALGDTDVPAIDVHPTSAFKAWHLWLILLAIALCIWLCIKYPEFAELLFDIAGLLFKIAIIFYSDGKGGGFGGGGGSFGGGGASGRW